MNKKSALIWALLLCILSNGVFAQKKIVVLGSSTASGAGASNYANSWVGKYASYITSISGGNTLTNLAVGGYNTYLILPTGTPHPGRPGQDTLRNITAAIVSHDADVVIVNMPSNDVANSYDVSETLLNYRRIKQYADSAGVVVYFTTSQPRNFSDAGKLWQLMQIRDSTIAQYDNFSIDFWNGIANSDGTIMSMYNVDGIHVNDAAHDIFFQRVKAKPILGNNALPIFLKSFKGNRATGSIKLEWEIDAGGEMVMHEVQRSNDGLNFSVAGRIPATNSTSLSFKDSDPSNVVIYYRLKLVTSSYSKYSDVLHVRESGKTLSMAIFPNPVTSGIIRLQLYSMHGSKAILSLSSINGKEVHKQELSLQRGVSTEIIKLPSLLSNGIYCLRILDANQGIQQMIYVQ